MCIPPLELFKKVWRRFERDVYRPGEYRLFRSPASRPIGLISHSVARRGPGELGGRSYGQAIADNGQLDHLCYVISKRFLITPCLPLVVSVQIILAVYVSTPSIPGTIARPALMIAFRSEVYCLRYHITVPSILLVSAKAPFPNCLPIFLTGLAFISRAVKERETEETQTLLQSPSLERTESSKKTIPSSLTYPFLTLVITGAGFAAWYLQKTLGAGKHGNGGIEPKFEWKSQLLGYLSAALYLGSRVPQIAHN
jgi:hypothetical protein